eukprot:GHVU01189561.1.p1 GENE.GHVU01189561.1~~GHVU01189561.1.p1  ORF type:complete len:186 (-),score=6.29 GHVU01189561.1:274-831(-)
MCPHTHVPAHTHTHAIAHTCTRRHTRIHPHAHTHMHTHMQPHTYAPAHIHTHAPAHTRAQPHTRCVYLSIRMRLQSSTHDSRTRMRTYRSARCIKCKFEELRSWGVGKGEKRRGDEWSPCVVDLAQAPSPIRGGRCWSSNGYMQSQSPHSSHPVFLSEHQARSFLSQREEYLLYNIFVSRVGSQV